MEAAFDIVMIQVAPLIIFDDFLYYERKVKVI